MVRPMNLANGVRFGDAHHPPTSFGRIAVQIFPSPRCIGDSTLSQLPLSVIVAKAGVLHGFAYGRFGVALFNLPRSEGLLIEPSHGVIQLEVSGGMSGRKLCGQSIIDFGIELRALHARSPNAHSCGGL